MSERRRLRFASILIILTALCVAGCSSGGGRAEEGTPGAAVQTFYDHLDSGAYDAAQAMYSNAAREIVADPEMFRSWAAQATRDGTIDKVVIVGSTIAESQTDASVDFDIAFRDGSTAAYSVDLVDEGGEWKLGLVVPR